MLFTLLLCSFVVVNNAVQLSLQPMFNHSEGNLMSQILAHKNNAESDQSLIDLFGKLDPAAINNVITLVEAMLSSSQADLDRFTSDSDNADAAYNAAVAAHNAALVAQSEGTATAKKTLDDGVAASLAIRDSGVTDLETTHDQNVAALQATHDQIVTSLQAAVDAAVTAKDTTETTKATANAILNQEKSRLDTEIASLTTVIALLHGVRGCQAGWEVYDGYCYFVVGDITTWDAARAYCQSMNADLTSILSDAENTFVASINPQTSFWIGGRDLVGNNVDWTWSDGSAWSYSIWNNLNIVEPNNKAEQCVMMRTLPNWNDATCNAKLGSVCKAAASN